MRDLDGVELRPATEADLPDCERIWRDGLNDYLVKLNQVEIPEENPGLRRLHGHALSTDPDRFAVAVRSGRVVAFGSAIQRGDVGFLSMLFVDPGEQGRGLGRALLGRILPVTGSATDGPAGRPPRGPAPSLAPTPTLATVTDSVQPISNALYASLGIVPRMPLFNLVGRPRAGWTGPALPDWVTVAPLPGGESDAEVAALDRAVVGYEHAADHAFMRGERSAVFGYRDADGALVGYGYASEVGRIGPVAVRDPELLAPVIAHLLAAVEPRGASAIWLPGGAGPTFRACLEAGLRLEDFPLLLCWSRPFADFGRYVPISPGLP